MMMTMMTADTTMNTTEAMEMSEAETTETTQTTDTSKMAVPPDGTIDASSVTMTATTSDGGLDEDLLVLDADETTPHEMAAVTLSETVAQDFVFLMAKSLNFASFGREQYIQRVMSKMEEAHRTAQTSRVDISVFLDAVSSRIDGVRADGATLHEQCLVATYVNHDYEIMRCLRDEKAIRLRLDLANTELDQMLDALRKHVDESPACFQ